LNAFQIVQGGKSFNFLNCGKGDDDPCNISGFQKLSVFFFCYTLCTHTRRNIIPKVPRCQHLWVSEVTHAPTNQSESSTISTSLFTSQEGTEGRENSVIRRTILEGVIDNKTSQNKTRPDKTRSDDAVQDGTRQKTRQDKTRRAKPSQDKPSQAKTRRDKIRQDETRHDNTA
jgi:hypothetical protein